MVRYSRELQASGNLLLSGVRPHVFEILEHTGVLDAIGKENIFPDQGVQMEPLDQDMARAREWVERGRATEDA